VAIWLITRTYPNYDSYYHLVWGREALDGLMPSFEAYAAPTQHPLYVAVAAVLGVVFGESADRAAPESPSLSNRNASRSKFSIEPLEPRVLLSADPISTVLYRTLQEDDAAAEQSDFTTVTEQLDAATSAEIAVANGATYGDAQTDSGTSVAWSGSWAAASADDSNTSTNSNLAGDEFGADHGLAVRQLFAGDGAEHVG